MERGSQAAGAKDSIDEGSSEWRTFLEMRYGFGIAGGCGGGVLFFFRGEGSSDGWRWMDGAEDLDWVSSATPNFLP